jgi:hypothetical protein
MRNPSSGAAWLPGVIMLALWPFAAAGQGVPSQHIGGDKGWDAYDYTERAGKVCYLVGTPAKSEPAHLNRGRIDVLVTNRPKENAVNVVNFDLGYPVKPDSTPEIDIDGRKFTLFGDKEAVWAQDAATDKAVTEALAKGKRAVLKAVSARGATTADTYALDGFKEALAAIDKDCGVRR